MKKIAILQSNYIPWKGYFDLINSVDEFVLYDDMQYTKNDWRNRNKIKTPQGVQWLTIPVTRKSLGQKIKDTQVSDPSWRNKHWKTICQNYGKAKYFSTYAPLFESLYLNDSSPYLSEINKNFILAINSMLGSIRGYATRVNLLLQKEKLSGWLISAGLWMPMNILVARPQKIISTKDCSYRQESRSNG